MREAERPRPIRPNTSSCTVTEIVQGGCPLRPVAAGDGLQQALGHASAQIDLARKHLPDRLDHVRGSLLLVNVAVGTGMERALREERFLVHGADQDPRAARMGRESADQLEAAALRQGQVHDGEVRHGLADELQGPAEAPALTAHLEIGLARDQGRESGAYQRVIIHDQDAPTGPPRGGLGGTHESSTRLPSIDPPLSRSERRPGPGRKPGRAVRIGVAHGPFPGGQIGDSPIVCARCCAETNIA